MECVDETTFIQDEEKVITEPSIDKRFIKKQEQISDLINMVQESNEKMFLDGYKKEKKKAFK